MIHCGKILVVDDEASVRELLRDAFGRRGFEVLSTPSAAQGLEIIFKEQLDLILLDVKLSQESGLLLLRKIRQHQAKIPVVIYSGVITAELEKEARAAGADEVLNKNIEIGQLIAQIEKILKAKGRIFQPSTKKKTILVVDDDEEVRHLLKDFFIKKGFEVLEAENGEKAIELVSAREAASVLLDMNMPKMDGLTTLERLLQINPKLAVVMVTADQDDEKVNKALELGAYSYVLKPFDFLYLELVVMSKLAIAEGWL